MITIDPIVFKMMFGFAVAAFVLTWAWEKLAERSMRHRRRLAHRHRTAP